MRRHGFVAGICLLGVAQTAMADLTANVVLAPAAVPGNSFKYALGFSCGGTGCNFDMVAFRVTFNGPWDAPALSDFKTDDLPSPFGLGSTEAVGWSEVYNDGAMAIATGPGVDDIFTLLNSDGVAGDPFVFDAVVFSGSNLVQSVNVISASEGLGYGTATWFPDRTDLEDLTGSVSAEVQVPQAVTLSLVGLVLVGWFQRRDTLLR